MQSLLGEPNNASPLNGQAAQMWDNTVSTRGLPVDLEEYTGIGQHKYLIRTPAPPPHLPAQVEFRRVAVLKFREATGSNPTSGWGAAGET